MGEEAKHAGSGAAEEGSATVEAAADRAKEKVQAGAEDDADVRAAREAISGLVQQRGEQGQKASTEQKKGPLGLPFTVSAGTMDAEGNVTLGTELTFKLPQKKGEGEAN